MITHHVSGTASETRSDTLPYEVEQFCNLLARIYMRCLREQDPQVLARLKASAETTKEGSNAAA